MVIPELSDPSVERAAVELRDRLIAAQETLLNRFRCLFNIDVGVVSGGCRNRAPVFGPVQPGVFPGFPTQADIDKRDELIAAQEALLNTYRCLFNTDVAMVIGGCRI